MIDSVEPSPLVAPRRGNRRSEAWRQTLVVLRWLLGRRPRNVVAWLSSLVLALTFLQNGWLCRGEAAVDFAGQWLMGRHYYLCRADELYLVAAGKEIFATEYQGDDLKMVVGGILLKGGHVKEPIIEGPLYPPTAGLMFWPIMVLPPQAAHAVVVTLYVLGAFLNGYWFQCLTRGRVQWGEANLLIFAYPNFFQSVLLGQNSMLTLTVVTAGWMLLTRGHSFLAGVAWGVLAYKPVFAVPLLLVPMLLLNRRMFLGMVLGGLVFVGATLPFVGISGLERFLQPHRLTEELSPEACAAVNPWERWLRVGRSAAEIYAVDYNWVWMSRDLIGLPRRRMWRPDDAWTQLRYLAWLDDFSLHTHQATENGPVQTAIGVGLIAAVLGTTLLIAAITRWRDRHALAELPTQPWGAFLLLGLLHSVYHYMHYDMLVMALPTALLLADVPRLGTKGRWFLACWCAAMVGCNLDMAFGNGIVRVPTETLLSLMLWGWAGWRTCVAPPLPSRLERDAAAGAVVGEAHQPQHIAADEHVVRGQTERAFEHG